MIYNAHAYNNFIASSTFVSMIILQPAGTRASVQGVSTTKNGIGICTQLLSGSLIIIFRSVTAHCILSGLLCFMQSVGIFSFESEEFGREGQRRYIVATYYDFGKRYL